MVVNLRNVVLLLVFSFTLLNPPGQVTAGIIVQSQTGASGGGPTPIGQSVTTTAGGPWNNITFNFYSAANTPAASGSLYMLSQAYLGTPAALSTSTPGFLATTNTISGNVWQFNSSVTLNPNTQYFFYTNSAIPAFLLTGTGGTYTGGNGYFALGVNNGFASISNDMNFDLSGTIVAVPEPSSIALVGLAAAGAGARCWRKRAKKTRLLVEPC